MSRYRLPADHAIGSMFNDNFVVARSAGVKRIRHCGEPTGDTTSAPFVIIRE